MTNKAIEEFLDSGLLESYALGHIDPGDVDKVERYINDSEVVKKAYEEIQENLALLSKKLAVVPPAHLKSDIINKIDELDRESRSSESIKRRKWLPLAGLAGIFALLTLLAYNKKRTAENNYIQLEKEFNILQEKCEEQRSDYLELQRSHRIMANVGTERYKMQATSGQFSSLAYINPMESTAYLHLLDLPALPQNKCLQLWADIDGKMISWKILPDTEGEIISIPYDARATSLNVTVEPKGGSDHPTLSNLIASVSLS